MEPVWGQGEAVLRFVQASRGEEERTTRVPPHPRCRTAVPQMPEVADARCVHGIIKGKRGIRCSVILLKEKEE